MFRLGGVRAGVLAAVGCVMLAAACSSGSSSAVSTPTADPHPSVTSKVAGPPVPTPGTSALQRAQLAAGATHLWPLAGAPAGAGSVADLGSLSLPGTVKGGKVVSTIGPGGTTGAQFVGAGYIATPVPASAVGMDRRFTIEFAFRSDNCTRAWSNAAGTGAFVAGKRLGLNVLHYPSDFSTACRMAFEFWNAGTYTGGCSTPQPAAKAWVFYALTWNGASATCYASGKAFGRVAGAHWTSEKGTPFGIGGAGSGWGGALDSGSLADVALYATALTPAQLTAQAKALSAT